LEKDKKVLVSIKNTGSGIPKEDLPFVFERFYKTDRSRGLDKTGMGIGLFIVKTIINKHGEDIKVSSVENEFCDFTFSLSVCDPFK
jgi:signal transduction histidine kinase